MARLAMDHMDIVLADEMDLARHEMLRLKTNLTEFMRVTSGPARVTLITAEELQKAGSNMWYRVTDDDCRLRGGGPEMFAAHLMGVFFPKSEEPS
jgi:hypothetical protein